MSAAAGAVTLGIQPLPDLGERSVLGLGILVLLGPLGQVGRGPEGAGGHPGTSSTCTSCLGKKPCRVEVYLIAVYPTPSCVCCCAACV